MRLGLFGGTFDPPHLGHLIAAQDALMALDLDRIHFIPAAQPPHKPMPDVSAPAVRTAMLSAAIGEDTRFVLDDVELKRTGPSYTVDTLREYRTREPGAQLFLLMGADQWAEFETWRETDTIRLLATVVVMTREGEGAADGNITRIPVTRMDVSSTEVRSRVAHGRPIRYLVPDAVAELIYARGLYRVGGDRHAPDGVGSASDSSSRMDESST